MKNQTDTIIGILVVVSIIFLMVDRFQAQAACDRGNDAACEHVQQLDDEHEAAVDGAQGE